MSRDNSPPFSRGETYYGGRVINSAALEGVELEGRVKEFEDMNINAVGAKVLLTAFPVWCMVVRNSTGAAILPGSTVALDPTNPGHALSVPAALAARHAAIADEYLPAAGVPSNDLFWVVINGPTTGISDGTPTAGSIAVTSATSTQVANGTIATIAQLEARFGKFLATQASAGSPVRIYMHPDY